MTRKVPPTGLQGRNAARASPARNWQMALVAVVAVTFLVYLPSLDNGFTNWDDNHYVTENGLLASPDFISVLTTPVAGNYHPLTIWSLALNYRISKLDPVSYHGLNLLLHLANTMLVFFFIWQLSNRRLWTSIVTSLFFGIHPMHVESVAWVAERKDVLYTLFYLAGLIAYLHYIEHSRMQWLAAAWLALVLSSASKPAAIVFPVSLLAIDYFRGRPFTARVVVEKLPFLVVAVIDGLLTLQAQQSSGAITDAWSPFQKLLLASYGLVMYVVKLFVPIGLSAIHPYPSPVSGPGEIYYWMFAIAAVGFPAILYLSRRVRVIQFGFAFFLINIVLVLQIFSIGGAVMAERYTYLSYVGLLFALSWWLDEHPGPRLAGLPARTLAAILFMVLLPVSLIQTWRRCDVWANSETLWNDTIQKYPGQIPDAYIHRGHHHYKVGDLDAALADYDRALALNSRTAGVWLQRANIFAERGQYDSALVSYDRVLVIEPDRTEALNNRGAAKLQQGDWVGAVVDLTQAIELNPEYRDAYTNRSLASLRLHDFERALADAQRAIGLDPGNPDNYLHYSSAGFALQQMNRHAEAIEAYEEVIRLAPEGTALGGVFLNRSVSFREVGDKEHALADAREALRRGAEVPDRYLRELER